MICYLNQDGTISTEDDAGRLNETASIEDARKAWENGEVTNYNRSFSRLATQFNFNVQALHDWYEANMG